MRLDAHKGDVCWNVWQVPTARQLRYVVWVDSDIKAWGEYMCPIVLDPEGPRIVVRSAKRIDIHVHERLVLIYPIEDEEAGETPAEVIEEIAA